MKRTNVSTTTTTMYARIARLEATIARIPQCELPHGLARGALIDLALSAVEMNVYQRGNDEWAIWLRAGAAGQGACYTLAEWGRDYATLAAEALARQAGKVGAA